MHTKPILVQLEAEQVAELDALGELLSESRSALIRRAIDDMLKGMPGRQSGWDAYERIPLDTPDEWGNLDDWCTAVGQARAE